jgi:catechol-2,3-dioxygenase
MPAGPAWLTLKVECLDRAESFYDAFLELDVRDRREREVVFAAGETDPILRAPDAVPRGGPHRGGRRAATA